MTTTRLPFTRTTSTSVILAGRVLGCGGGGGGGGGGAAGSRSKRARRKTEPFTSTEQGPLPEHGPSCQPANRNPGGAVGVSWTVPPDGKAASQNGRHEIPVGELVMLPKPSGSITRKFPTVTVPYMAVGWTSQNQL